MIYQLRLFCVFVAAMALSQSSNAQYDDVLSYAVGYHGLNLIVQNPKFHPQFSITGDQVVRLKEILEDKAIMEKYSKTSVLASGPSRMGIDRNGRTRILDEFVRAPQILDKTQLDAIRLFFLKQQFPRPSDAWSFSSLRQFDFNEAEVVLISRVTEPLITDMVAVRNRQVGEALKEVMPWFTDAQKQRIANLAGNKVASGFIPKSRSIDELQIDRDSQPVRQMYRSFLLPLPKQLRITEEKIEQINRLAGKFEVKSVGRGHLDLNVGEELSKILSEEQRLEIIRQIHWASIIKDVRWLAKPEVLAFVKVGEDFDRERFIALLTRSQEKIMGTETLMQKRIFYDGLKAVPTPKRKQMEELLVNVWTFD